MISDDPRLSQATVQLLRHRVHVSTSRPAFAGLPGRVLMRGRHTADLSHALAGKGIRFQTLTHKREQTVRHRRGL